MVSGKFALDVLNKAHCFSLQETSCLAALKHLIYCEFMEAMKPEGSDNRWHISMTRYYNFKCVTPLNNCAIIVHCSQGESGAHLCGCV